MSQILDSPNQILTKGKILESCIWYFRTLYSNWWVKWDWFLPTELEKVGRERDEIRTSRSQLSLCINDLQASASALKETLICLSCRAEVAENQAESCLESCWIATQIEFTAWQAFVVRVRHWWARKGIPEIETGTCEQIPVHLGTWAKSSLPVIQSFPLSYPLPPLPHHILSEQVNPSLLEEPVTTSPEVVTLQSTIDFPQDLPSSLLLDL